MKTVLRGYLCFGASVLLLGGLLVAPKTGWLVRQQAQAALGGRGEALVKSLEGPKEAPKFSAVGELARKLRALCSTKLKLERKAEESFYAPRFPVSGGEPPLPRDFSLYDVQTLTAQGEALDPGNAFFPALRAVALLMIHSDEQALAELHKAAQLPRWDDYTREEIHARLQQLDQVQGAHTALADMQVEQSMTASHLARMRALGRVVIAMAAKKELAGEWAAGLAIRHDLRALGEKLRDQGSWAPTQNLGITLTTIATARPGGELPKTYTGSSEETRTARQRDALVAHEKYWGKAEAIALERVLTRNNTVKSFHEKQRYASDNFYGLAAQWEAELRLLGAIVATLFIGAFCALLAKLSQGKPARPGVRFSLWWIIGIVPALIYRAGLSEDETALRFCLAGVLSLIGLFALWQAWRTTKRAQRWQEAGLVLATLLGAAQVILFGIVAMWGGEDTIGAFYDTYLRCFSASEGAAISWWESFWHEADYRVFFALPILVPLLSLVPILAIVSRVKRVPVTFGVARGLGRCALPMALVLTIVYAWQVQRTATLEAQLRTALRSSLSQ
ncbi:hypothetical protein [Armatimonas sp.]|uniref:hypothetical protein n=1 Tax=Armatimonas sp. TaxID=1872638 RepID=UPI00374CB45E